MIPSASARELTPELVFLHLSEEVGEIARQLVNKNLAIREYDEGNLKEEIIQAMLDLFVLSEVHGIDLPTALTRKIEETAKKATKSELNPANLNLQSENHDSCNANQDVSVSTNQECGSGFTFAEANIRKMLF